MENLLFGIRPLLEALDEGKLPEKVLLQKGLSGDNFKRLFKKIRDKKVPFQMVPAEKLKKITKQNHQGVIAYLSLIYYISIENLVKQFDESSGKGLIVIIDRITDIRNLGAIARTAECAGVHGIIMPSKGSASINADAIKTSVGALSRIPVCRENDLMEAIEFLKLCGIAIIACTERSSQSIYETNMDRPIALVFGSEEKGISNYLLNIADEKAAIPMKGKTSSLNVSVAAGIAIFEALRQRAS